MNSERLDFEISKGMDIDTARQKVVDLFNKENNKTYNHMNISLNEYIDIKKWLYKKDPFISLRFHEQYGKHLSFDSKMTFLSQYHCPLCRNNKPNFMLPIETRIFSHQTNSTLKKEITKEVTTAIEKIQARGSSLFCNSNHICLLLVFSLSYKNKDKDIDNIAKHIIDVLKNNFFNDDSSIVHLNCIKIVNPTNNDSIYVNIRTTTLTTHDDILFPFSDSKNLFIVTNQKCNRSQLL